MAPATPSDFAARCTAAAQAFLRTVVVLDDYPADRPTEFAQPKGAVLEPPAVRRPLVGAEIAPAPDAGSPAEAAQDAGEAHTAAPPGEDPTHGLRGHELQSAFLDEGLICSVLFGVKPEQEKEHQRWMERVRRIGSRADVLVLDWQWSGDNGQFCRDMIGTLLDQGNPLHRQLVIIYTAENDKDAFRDRLKDLQPEEEKSNFHFGWPQKGMYLNVVQKPKATGDEFYSGSKVPEADLPSRVFELFGERFGGLLANAAMHALGGLRESGHRILGRFRPELDAPYVVHRAYTIPSVDAEEQVAGLLSDSLTDTISAQGVTRHVDDSAVETWLKARSGVELLKDQKFEKYLGADPTTTLTMGHENIPPKPSATEQMMRIVGNLMRGTNDEGKAALERFSAFVYSAEEPSGIPPRRENGSLGEGGQQHGGLPRARPSFPRLENGTVVEDPEGRILLCVLPACDAARIGEKGRAFPFLTVQCEKQKGSKHFVIERDGEPLVCCVSPKAHELLLITFRGRSKPGSIRAVEHEGAIGFIASDETRYRYLARLRPLVAREVTTLLGNSVARIGLMESEFIRLHEK